MDRVMGSGRRSQWEMVDERGRECIDWSVESGQWSQWAMESVGSGGSSMGVWVLMYGVADVWMGAWAVRDGVCGKWWQVHGCVGADG